MGRGPPRKDNGDGNEGKEGLDPNRYLLLRAEDNRGRTMGQKRIGNRKGQKGHAYEGANNEKWERAEKVMHAWGQTISNTPWQFPIREI